MLVIGYVTREAHLVLKKLYLTLIIVAPSLIFALPALAVDAPVGNEQATEQTQNETEDEEVVCRDLIIGRDRIPSECIGQTTSNEPREGVICRNVPVTGSRIPKRVCMTQEERDRQREADLEFLRRNSTILSPAR